MTYQPRTREEVVRADKRFRYMYGGLVYPRWEADRARTAHRDTRPGTEKDAARRALLRVLIRFLGALERADRARDAALGAWISLHPDQYEGDDLASFQHVNAMREVCEQAMEETRLEILAHLLPDDVV
jgi:hypothetical protein